MSDEEKEPPAQTPASHVSPLKNLLIEFHEVYEELSDVGFSEDTSAKIIANMLLEVVLYRGTSEGMDIEVEYEESDENDEEEDDSDGPDTDGDTGVG